MRIGGIEAGGTKMVCAVATDDGTLLERVEIPTRTPADTVPEMLGFFKGKGIESLGIGCFGPVDLNPESETYGYITSTPKLAWADYNIVGAFQEALGVPVGFDTDVNGAIMGEAVWGAAKGCRNAIYITVGTGIGVGVCINGEPLHGLVHPEGGHILMARQESDSFEGCCPYHGCCLEGMASGPAIEKRWGKPGRLLQDKKEVWELEAFYLAQAVANYIMLYSPEKVILGGGVMHQEGLLEQVQKKVVDMLAGYVHNPMIEKHIESYIVHPALKDNPGILGAVYLGMRAYQNVQLETNEVSE